MDTDFLLIGKCGQGRSATGNSILGNTSFKSASAMTPVTVSVDFDYAVVQDRIVKVVDTPGWEDFSDCRNVKDNFSNAMKSVFVANSKGYDAFLIVIRFGTRVTEEEVTIVNLLKAEFCENFVREYCIIVMTFGDLFKQELGCEDASFQKWCQHQTGPFKELLTQCSGRIILFDNKSNDSLVKTKQNNDLFSILGLLKNEKFRQELPSVSVPGQLKNDTFRQELPSVGFLRRLRPTSATSSSSGQVVAISASSSSSAEPAPERTKSFPNREPIEETFKEMSLVIKELKHCQHSFLDEVESLEVLLLRTEALLCKVKRFDEVFPQWGDIIQTVTKTKDAISEEIKLNVDLKSYRDEYKMKNTLRESRYLERKVITEKRYASLLAECPNDPEKQKTLSNVLQQNLLTLENENKSEKKAVEDDFSNMIREKRQERIKKCPKLVSAEKLEEQYRQSRSEYLRDFLFSVLNVVVKPFKLLFTKVFGKR